MSGSNNTPDNWVGGSDNWSTGSDWSTGTPPNGSSATIAPTTPVTVTINDQESAGTVTVGSGNTLVFYNGNLAAAAMLVNAGTLTDYTYAYQDSITAPSLNNTGTIEAVSLNSPPFALDVTGQITNTAAATISAGNAVGGYTSTLQLGTGTASTLSNAGTVTAGANGTVAIVGALSNTGTVTATQGGTVSFGAAVTNAGSITAGTGGTLAFASGVTVANNGTIAVNGGALEIDGNANGSSVAALTSDGLTVGNGTLTGSGGGTTTVLPTLRFSNGTYTNTGATLSLGAFGTLDFENETINGGTINSNGGLLELGGTTTLNGVTLTGPVAFLPGYFTATTVTTSVTFDAATTLGGTVSGYPSGANINLGKSGQQSTLTIGPLGTVTGDGTIAPVSGAQVSIVNKGSIASGANLTIGAVTLLDNQGTIAATGGSIGVSAQSVTDEGTISATSGGSVIVSSPVALPASAVVSATGGGTVTFDGVSSTAATITANGGTVVLAAASYYGTVNDTWINTGTINIGNGGLLQIVGNETIADLGTINRTGSGAIDVEAYDNVGTLDLGGQTLGAGNAEFAGLEVGVPEAGGYGGYSATLANGTVDQPGLGLVVGAGAVFNNVDITGNLSFSAPYGEGASATLEDGSTVYSDASKSTLGTITVGAGSELNVLGANGQVSLSVAQTVNLGNGILNFGTGSGAAVAASIGYGKVVEGNGSIGTYGSDQVTLTNTGTIEATAGNTVTVNLALGNLANNTLTGGTYIAIGRSGYYGTGGLVQINDNGSQVVSTLDADVELQGETGLGDYGLTGNSNFVVDGSDIQSSLTTIGAQGRLVLTTGENFQAANAVVNNGTIVIKNGGNFTAPTLVNNGTLEVDSLSTYSSPNFTNNGTVTLAGGTFNGLVNVAGATLVGYGLVTGPVSNNGIIEVSGGTLEIDGPVTGTGSFKIDPSGTLVLEGADGQTVTFSSPGGVLSIGTNFTGAIANLAPGDTIDFHNAEVRSATLTSGGLVVGVNGGTTFTVPVSGPATTSEGTEVQYDGTNGTDATVLPIAADDANATTYSTAVSGSDYAPALGISYAGQANSTGADTPYSLVHTGTNWVLDLPALPAGTTALPFSLIATNRNTGPDTDTVTYTLIGDGGDIASSSGPSTITGILPGGDTTDASGTIGLGPQLTLQNGTPSTFLVQTTANGVALPAETLVVDVGAYNADATSINYGGTGNTAGTGTADTYLTPIFPPVGGGGGDSGPGPGPNDNNDNNNNNNDNNNNNNSNNNNNNNGNNNNNNNSNNDNNNNNNSNNNNNNNNHNNKVGGGYGDPHLTTFDGLTYDLQQVGEFILAKSTALGDTFQVQIRTSPFNGGSTAVAGTYQLAVQVGSDIVDIDPSRSNATQLEVDGVAPTFTNGSDILAGGYIVQLATFTWQINLATGEQVTVMSSPNYVGPAALTYTIALGNSYSAGGGIEGLLGNADGNTANDFMLPDGTVLTQPLQPGQLYQQFAQAWAVTDQDSILSYPGGTPDTEAYTNTAFPVGQPQLANLPTQVVQNAQAAVQAAGLDPNSVAGQNAVLDFALTNDPALITDAVAVTAATGTPTATGPQSATGTADTTPAPGQAQIGGFAPTTNVTESNTATVPVTFDVYSVGAVTADTPVAWSVVGGAAGTLGAAAFGGTLPSGTVTIPNGSSQASFTVNLPPGALGTDPSDALTVQFTPPTGDVTLSGTATVTVANATPQRGTDAAPEFALLSGSAALTIDSSGNATLNLGSIFQNSASTPFIVTIANDGTAQADALGASFVSSGSAAITATGAASFTGLVAGQTTDSITITPTTATLGQQTLVLTMTPTETNASGYSGTLPTQTLTVTADIVQPTGDSAQALPAGPGVQPQPPTPGTTPTLTIAANAAATTIGIVAPTDSAYAASQLSILIQTLPTDGTISLPGSGVVAAGQTLSVTQLQALQFTPDPTKVGVTSNLVYTVTDPSGLAANGTAAVAVSVSTNPVATAATLTVAGNAAATPIGIAAPTDPYFAASQLTITVGTLPTDGIVTLANGFAVTAGEELTPTQLSGLQFTPTPGQFGATSNFTYTVTDPASNTTTGTAALAIAPAVGNPVETAATLTVAPNAAATAIGIAAPTDPNFSASQLTITVASTPINGTVSLANGNAVSYGQVLTAAQLTGLQFTPVPGEFSFSSSFSYTVTDPASNTSTGSATLAIGPAVGNPVVTPATLTVAENAAATAIGIVAPTDPNFGASQLSIIVNTVPTDGTISIYGLFAVSAGESLSPANLTSLTFTPTRGQSGVSSSFTYTVTDPASNATTGTATLAIAGAPINDTYTIGGTVAGQSTTDAASVNPFAAVTLGNPNASAVGTATVVLSSAANGTFSNLGGGTLSAGGTTYTVSGSTAAIQAALQGLMFKPTPHEVAPGQVVSSGFTLTVADSASTATDSTTSVSATALNTPPTIGGTSSTVQIDTAGQTDTPFSAVTITDPDFGATETATITLTNGGVATDADGTLSGATKTGVGTYTLAAGSPAAVQAALRALVFNPTPNLGSVTGFTLGISDGIAPAVANMQTVVQALPAGVTPNPQNPSSFNSSSTSNETNTVTTPVAQTNNTVATTITAVLDGTQVVYQQSFALPYSDPAVQAAIAQADAILVQDGATPSTPALTGTTTTNQGSTTTTVTTGQTTGVPTVSVTTNFGPGTLTENFGGVPGSSLLLLAGQTDVNVNVDTVTTVNQTATTTTTVLTTQAYAIGGSNDAYSIGGAKAAQATTDAATLAPFAAITLANPDTQAIGTATVTLSSAANGTLSNLGGGLLSAGGSIYTVMGSTAAIQAALQALVFTPTPHEVLPGQAVTTGFTLSVSDGVANASDATTSVVATALPVGVPSVASPSVTVAENGPATAIGIAAPSDPSFAASQLVLTAGTLPSDGSVTLGDGVTPVVAGQVLTAAQLTGLLFTPTAGQFGQLSSFTYTATDPEGNASTGTATLAIGPALGNPAVSSPTLTVAENTGATVIGIAAPTDPNFTASQLTITVSTLPTDGVVTLANGPAVTAGQVLTLAQLTGLKFAPTASQFGASSSFTYTVTDPASNMTTGTATLAIGPALGNPVATAAALTVAENAAATSIGIAAPTDPNYATSQLTLAVRTLPADGTVTLADGVTAVTAQETLTAAQLTGLKFKPTAGQFGASSSFTYTVTDPASNTTTGTTTLAIGPALGNPVASSTTVTVAENAAATAIGIATPTDPNFTASQLTITVSTLPTDGVVTLANGPAVTAGQVLTLAQLTGLKFAPTSGQFGASSSFTYTVTDPASNTTTGTATLAIGPALGNPVVSSTTLTVAENAAATAIAIAAPTDPNYAPGQLVITAGTLPTDGTVTLADGLTRVSAGQVLTVAQLTGLLFTPAPGQSGASSAFTYTVRDPAGNTGTGVATLAIGVTVHPFATLVLSSASSMAAFTVSVAPQPFTGGIYSNLGSGSIASDGATYTVSGTVAQVNAALAALTLTLPAGAPAMTGYVASVNGSGAPGQLTDTSALNSTLTALGTGDVLIGGTGKDVLIGNAAAGTLLGGSGSSTFFAEGGPTTIVGDGAQDVVSALTGSDVIFTAVGGQTLIGLGTGPAVVDGQGADTIIGGSGSLLATTAADSTVFLGGGAATISAATGDMVVGAAGTTFVAMHGGGLTLFSGSGETEFLGGTGSNAGSNTVTGGSGGSAILFAGDGGGSFAGGTGGNNVIVGGLQKTTIMGGGSGDNLFAVGSAGTVIVAGAGNETLVGAYSSGIDTFFAGPGNDLIGLGSGADVVFAGTGAATVFGGAGKDIVAFVNGQAGGSVTLLGFKAGTDQLTLQGYGGNEAATASASAITTAAIGAQPVITMVTLTDNTKITFIGLGSLPTNVFG